jgi:hypothetical protein
MIKHAPSRNFGTINENTKTAGNRKDNKVNGFI